MKKQAAKILALLVLISIMIPFNLTTARADDTVAPQINIIGASDTDSYVYDTLINSDGSYVVCGYTYSKTGIFADAGNGRAFIAKYDTNNNLLWLKRFGGAYDDGGEAFNKVIQTEDAGYVVVGYTKSYNGDISNIRWRASNFDAAALIVKYSSDGVMEWGKIFDGGSDDNFSDVIGTSDGGFIAIGTSHSYNLDMYGISKGGTSNSNGDGIIIKYSSDGTKLWQKVFGGTGADIFYRAVSNGADGCLIIGYTTSTDMDMASYTNGYSKNNLIINCDSTGNIDWISPYGFDAYLIPYMYFSSLCKTQDGGFAVSGYTSNNTSSKIKNIGDGITLRDGAAFVFKYSSSGQLMWRKFIDGSGNDYLSGICEMADGSIMTVGRTESTDYDFANVTRKCTAGDAVIINLASSGEINSMKTFSGSRSCSITSVYPLQGDDFVVSGFTSSNNGDFADIKSDTVLDGFVAKFITPDVEPPTINTDSITVGLSFSDDEAGIATQYYAWSNNNTDTPINWTEYTDPVTQSTFGIWYLWAKVTDRAGNTITRCVGGPYVVGQITE